MPNSAVEIVRLKSVEPHNNADRLEVVQIFGFPSCVEKGKYKAGDLVAFVPPDSIVETTRPEFSFLAGKTKRDRYRVRACKMRGTISYGLVVPAPEGSEEGQDVAERLGVLHYEPEVQQERGGGIGGEQSEPGPNVFAPKYDLENFRRYGQEVFEPGEPLACAEKIHGANFRCVFSEGRTWCGSRTQWKRGYPDMSFMTVESLLAKGVDEERAKEIVERGHKKGEKNSWWKVLDKYPGLEKFCRDNPGVVVYGEMYGCVQSLRYGHSKGEVSFAAFDILVDGKWADVGLAHGYARHYKFPWVPVLNEEYTIGSLSPHTSFVPIAYDFDKLCQLAEGQSLITGADHIREGIVVSPLKERFHPKLGRVKLKIVSAAYLEAN